MERLRARGGPAGLAAGLAALLALVALASGAGIPWDSEGRGARSYGDAVRLVALAGAAGALVAAAAALVLSRRARRRRRAVIDDLEEEAEEDPPSHWLDRVLQDAAAYLLLAVIALAIFVAAQEVGGRLPGAGAPTSATTVEDATQDEARPAGPQSRDPTWFLVGAVLVLAFAASAATLGRPLARRLRARPASTDVTSARTLAALVEGSIDDLRAEPDPRRAVVAAYARMEQGLARRGLPRRPSDAPLEYLGRLLAARSAGAPFATRLTELFERAKFSRHPLEPSAKQDAIECLVAIRDRLGAE